jgi:site-specific DNA recombinase
MSASQKITRSVAIYARKSKELETSQSCKHQISICKQKLEDLAKYDPQYEYQIFDTYIDEGKSGKNLDRPAMQRLIRDIKAKNIDILIIYKLDRLSRQLRDIFNFMDVLNEYDVDLVSCTDKDIDTTTAIGKMFFTITMAFAQMERDLASDRSKDMGLQSSLTGKFMGSTPPYGYALTRVKVGEKSVPKLVIDPEEAEIVKKIFQRYLNGESDVRISRWLNEIGAKKIQKGSGKPGAWTPSYIANLIADFRYLLNTQAAYDYLITEKIPYVLNRCEQMGQNVLGIQKWQEKGTRLQKGDAIGLLIEKVDFDGTKALQRFNGRITTLDAEPIIEDKVWIEAQRLRKKKATNLDHTIKSVRGDGPELLAGGLAVCATCGKTLTIRRRSRRMKSSYYHCYNRGGYDKDQNPIPKCPRCFKAIYTESLDQNIIDKLKSFFNDKKIIEDIINQDKKTRRNALDEIQSEIKELEKKRRKLEKDIDRITAVVMAVDDIAGDARVVKDYIKQQEQIHSQMDKIDQEIARLRSTPIKLTEEDYKREDLLMAVDSFAEFFDHATQQERKILAHYIVKRVIVEDEDNFEIELKFFEDFPAGTYLKDVHNYGDTPQGVQIIRE